MSLATRSTAIRLALPAPRGPLSSHLIDALGSGAPVEHRRDVTSADPFGDDLQLALYVAYELHYAGFDGVDDDREWDPDILGFRRDLERAFLDAVRREVGDIETDVSATVEMDELSTEPVDGDGVSFRLRDTGTWDQFRDLFAMRSVYHLKEADPHAWAIPRLRRTAKAAFVAVEFDEFGGGRGDAVHQELFADLLEAADLDARHLAYLDTAPAWALSPVNLMSCFGLHRALRGAAVGHLAATEITSPPGSARLLAGLERIDAPEACRHFYREHVEADAVHEQILRTDVVGALVGAEPELERDVVFGIRGFLLVEDKFDDGLQSAWRAGVGLRG
ncbi:iron-containing redox enzyme family protein [Gordonia sp. ABSL49_1]|uniref:iron-containing redox enzyme family protein n=1 Tax=Gordonia sp. ABSL49_1 TaxID=2920941 RepID=UPI001F0D306B|nr:iron-containing redox enzyme family protein [Gordonia sp. ABSL49_1]MCH5641222.1 iron-containing redox enzyme family protein [Gordonia sp. ABSL49_1]